MSELVKSVEFETHRISGTIKIHKSSKGTRYAAEVLENKTATQYFESGFKTASAAEDAAWVYAYGLAEKFDYDNPTGMEFDDELD